MREFLENFAGAFEIPKTEYLSLIKTQDRYNTIKNFINKETAIKGFIKKDEILELFDMLERYPDEDIKEEDKNE